MTEEIRARDLMGPTTSLMLICLVWKQIHYSLETMSLLLSQVLGSIRILQETSMQIYFSMGIAIDLDYTFLVYVDILLIESLFIIVCFTEVVLFSGYDIGIQNKVIQSMLIC